MTLYVTRLLLLMLSISIKATFKAVYTGFEVDSFIRTKSRL